MKIIKDKETLEFIFNKNIDYKLYVKFNDVEIISKKNISQVYLNFSNTQFITLPGCIYIIFLLYQIKINNRYFETRIISITESIIHILSKFGFFDSSSFYCNLQLDIKIESLIKTVRKISTSAIYWPIQTIPPNPDKNFESSNENFLNNYSDYFDLLIDNELIKSKEFSLNEIRSRFINSIFELIKNIWEHSCSWGLSSIQSTKITGTTICICDYGIGFITSYKNINVDYIVNPENNKRLIESQLENNFSSKSKIKHGHGLWRVKQFVDMVDGIMLIKTANYKVTYDGKTKTQKIKDDSFFMGTQIFINF